MTIPAITFGAGVTGFGAIDGFELQGSGSNVIYDRAVVLGTGGNEINQKLFNARTEVTATYKADLTGSAPTLPLVLGALVNSLILTGINLNTINNDFATMTLTGHNHTANAHVATPLNVVTHGYTLTDGFGVTDFLGGTAGDNASPISGSINIVCDHVDRLDESGDHLIGQNFNARAEATTTWAGVPGTASATFDEVSVETNQQNVDFLETVVNGVDGLTMAAAA